MEIGETTAFATFADGDACPMEPHSDSKGFDGKKKGAKSVPQLREAMKTGRSTRMWTQSGENFQKSENKDKNLERPEPDKGNSPLDEGKAPISICDQNYPLSIAAHHIIPGEASLPHSGLARFIWEENGLIKSDIGYDVDGSENGIWLPTHQIMSRAMGKAQKIVIHDEEDVPSQKGLSWEELSERAKSHEDKATYTTLFLRRYTQQAMDFEGVQAQFHDAHSNYNTWVIERLNGIDAYIQSKIDMCEKCKGDGKKAPPYMLVFRLNTLSKTIRQILKAPPSRMWRIVYTSEFARMYAMKPLTKNDLYG
ncbi:AHH domain-containing protein [Sorangium sp. So ce1153]|uniref:AHH domain-containing protein n=1 Tax=Sorangium sp. So ce1153 TaxID=3133333 RepID=UPI003F604950